MSMKLSPLITNVHFPNILEVKQWLANLARRCSLPVSGRLGWEARGFNRRGKYVFKIVLVLILGISIPLSLSAAPQPPSKVEYRPMPKPGEKVRLDNGRYFTYGFEKPPKLGMAIMRVEIFTPEGKRDTSFAVKGDADMPSMRGAHSSGDKDFSLSAKGLYLLPVRLVMPGDWEIRFTFMKNGTTIFRGAYLFDL